MPNNPVGAGHARDATHITRDATQTTRDVTQTTRDATHKYDYDFDPTDSSTAARVCRLVGQNQKVLELGCAAGAMTQVINRHYNGDVTGVEFDAAAAENARPYTTEMLVGDLNDPNCLANLHKKGSRFNAILMADVLEHLRDPEAVLRGVLPLLHPDGHVVISVPNIANGGVIAALWCDAFDYAETGLLDKTHIHFFTATTLRAMLERVGLVIDTTEYVDAGAWHPEFAHYWERIPPELRQMLEQHPPAQAFQIVVRAKRG